MNEYDFALKFRINSSQTNPETYIESLYEGGCDDALIGVGKQGLIALDFTREAASAYEAVSSAIANVKTVIPQVTLAEATPDLVGLTDVAKLLGCTRQNIRKLVITNEPGAPLPIYEGTPSIWHLAEILTWLQKAKDYSIDPALLDISKINMDINIARSWRRIESDNLSNFKDLVA